MIWDLFLSSFLLSVVLVGIHAYFGREIIRRGIIFADIAVAQFSALGLALSLTLFHGRGSYLLSLSLALLASLLIALSQRLREHSEAFIGLLYALGFSALFLLLSRSPHGVEEIKRLTAGDILFVPFQEVVKTTFIYSFIGALLYLRERFLRGLLSEFSFFSLFSLTLASSVSLVGVLVVFSLLVAPALVSLLLGKGLIFSWVWGTLLSLLALSASFNLDLPTGYSLVFLQALGGFLVFLFKIR
ncbi:MAG: metal ABC transporter permease [Aquificaceae bacterium]|nr:metal ABC transporter permease [Aquificaceae bacterium]MDW8033231.1 metal ABC transporter permease [Aquificaceae bacterium]